MTCGSREKTGGEDTAAFAAFEARSQAAQVLFAAVAPVTPAPKLPAYLSVRRFD